MKQEILQTSLKQFLKHGIREMSIQKLIEPLGISSKTVYKYFKNKEELLEEALHLYHAQQYEMFNNLPAEQSVACLLFDLWHKGVVLESNVNNLFFKDLHYYYPELGRKIDMAITKKFTQQFLLVIQRGIDEDAFEKDIVPEVVLDSILVLYSAIARTEHFKRFRLSPFDLLLNTIAVTIRGICTAKGREELDAHVKTLAPVKGVKALKKRVPVNPS